MKQVSLKELREELVTIDEEILHLLNKRGELSKTIGLHKREHGLDIHIGAKEKEKLHYLYTIASEKKYILSRRYIRTVFKRIFAVSRVIQKQVQDSV